VFRRSYILHDIFVIFLKTGIFYRLLKYSHGFFFNKIRFLEKKLLNPDGQTNRRVNMMTIKFAFYNFAHYFNKSLKIYRITANILSSLQAEIVRFRTPTHFLHWLTHLICFLKVANKISRRSSAILNLICVLFSSTYYYVTTTSFLTHIKGPTMTLNTALTESYNKTPY